MIFLKRRKKKKSLIKYVFFSETLIKLLNVKWSDREGKDKIGKLGPGGDGRTYHSFVTVLR